MQSQKRQNDLSSFQRKALNITVMQVYAPAINVEEGEAEQFYDDLQDLLELTPKKKDVLLIIGEWNARSTNQCKLEVVREEMARVNIDILGISELKWTRMGEFNSDNYYIYITVSKKLLEETA